MTINQTNVSHFAPGFKIEVNGSELDPKVAYSIRSVKVEQELNKTNAFTFEVQDDFREGRFVWLETKLFRVANPVSVAIGYTNNLTTVLKGKIKNINASFHTGCAPTFTVEGFDNVYDFLTTPGDTDVFNEKRDSDIVQKIAEKAHINAVVDATAQQTKVKTKQGGKSYMEFLETLAKENNYELFLAGNELHFKKDKYKDSIGTLSWGKEVIRFEPQLNTSSAVTEVIVRAWDSAGKKKIEGRAVAGDEDNFESGKSSCSQITKQLFGDVVKVITDKPARSVEEANKLARAELNNASNNLIQATLDTIGLPELTPGVCIDIAEFGTMFSGKYFVVKATHTIGTDGYKTSLNVRRNAV